MEFNNPFTDGGIVNYEQYKKYPFLLFGVQETINMHIEKKMLQINHNQHYGDRFILIGEKGAGKTSTLFFLKEKLEKNNFKVFYLTRLIQDFEHFELMTQEKLNEASKKPIFIYVDFPDTIEVSIYKKFLNFLWDAITNDNQSNINFIFTMNHSHYDTSFSYSEIFGKFITLRFDRLNLEETRELIQSRLNTIKKKIDNVMTEEAVEYTHKNTKGIPRNIISACFLLFQKYKDKPIDKTKAIKLYKDKLYLQIIKDRVKQEHLIDEYIQIINILRDDFNGIVKSKEDFNNTVSEKTGMGRSTTIKKINELERFGILVVRRGGYNRINRIISFV